MIAWTGGARKVRWAPRGRGKSGGVRAIYYYANAEGIILMLYIYAKTEQDTLTANQRKIRALIGRAG